MGVAPLKRLETLEYAAPTKAYEYMACGIPFIGCGNGEIANLANDSGAGVIADNTPEAIAAAISSLLDDPDRMEEMGRRGRELLNTMTGGDRPQAKQRDREDNMDGRVMSLVTG